MTYPRFQWRLLDHESPSADWQQQFAHWAASVGWQTPFIELVGQLLWQRGWRNLADIRGYLQVEAYEPTTPFAFGEEMKWAIARLIQAHEHSEKVAIWGDFDADGLTATAVLWEGLGQFFPQAEQLRYYIPNRFTESHGLSISGLDELADWGCTLIVTCDTGSTAATELAYAATLGMDVIVTDHHTLAETRPPVVALINPRQLPKGHPLGDLSGVAVAYKLVEALYERLPKVPQQPLGILLDLVAIGLIADLVALRGDCRYLTQRGLQVLEAQAKAGVRPGVTKLLEFCKRTGDRPSDVAFGIGPRINAVSRIHGDASFGVELLTSRDRDRAAALALEAELANTRRKELQANVLRQAKAQLETLDLGTTQVILLSDPQWSPGVLGLVASQIAQEYDRPTILFQTETTAAPGAPLMARGSARSVHQIDLYELVQAQSHLLTSFGGHPFAAGMTLPVENLPLLAAGLNRAVRSYLPTADLTQPPPLDVDCVITVADLGRDLFRALKLLEPYGMGNPIPRLLLRDVQITNLWEETLKDRRGGKQRYHKLTFDIVDPATDVGFPGHWWGHRRADLPEGRYDLVVELDVNTYKKRYEARLIDLCPTTVPATTDTPNKILWLIDQREQVVDPVSPPAMIDCPTDWSDFSLYRMDHPLLTLAYPPPPPLSPEQQWQQLLGIAKYLARTGESRPVSVLQAKLGLSDLTLRFALTALKKLGYTVQQQHDQVNLTGPFTPSTATQYGQTAHQFFTAVQEEHFRQQYFHAVPVDILEQVLGSLPLPTSPAPASND
ncbi:MAG: single-stranded-DNA-specific exonuclease RecJ [Leptolyngbya sp. SIOISBB]|nr:single-stranded-DNA-specific exonuclease RecJ [Leptolyngbya sp. SIOISBB]